VGNSGGFVTSWLGVGIFSAIASGVEAARAIALGHDYEKKMNFHYNIMKRSHKFRRLWDRLDNRGFDRAIGLMGSPPIKHALYNTNLNVLDAAEPLVDYLLNNLLPPKEKPLL